MADETFVAKVQLPDGTIGKFEVPVGMSPADIAVVHPVKVVS